SEVVVERLGLSFGLAWAIVIGLLMALRSWPRLRGWSVSGAVIALAACPVLVPSEFPGARALSVFVGFDAMFRVIDVSRRQRDGNVAGSLRTDLGFFVPFPVLLVTGEERSAARRITSTIGAAVARAAAGLTLFLAAWTVLFALQKSQTLRSSFALDHTVKSTLFAVTLEIIGSLAAGLERLCGFDAPRLMNRILCSRTPAEFWLRYNTRVHLWMLRNVFRRVGAAHHPVWGVTFVFFVSAVFHEAAFDVALSRIDGTQFAFFMLQIPAVLASPALERFAKRGGVPARVMAHAVTIMWLLITSVLFFRGIGKIFPFYYTAPMPGTVFGVWRLGS
ncbi:MAG TPA: MBOAT family O-acyltransferase, partial [Caulifigura sp.]|nr:MBOAT family O-acyltransferase [Caulifigura sp.]